MSVLDQLRSPDTRRLGALAVRIQHTGHPSEQTLSVFLNDGVVPRSSRADNHNELGSDLSRYQLVDEGDLVFNRLRTWQGGFGASAYRGIVSPAYLVLRPTRGTDARYVDYVLHSAPYLAELTRISKWMPPSQFDVLWSDLRRVQIPWLELGDQRRIADFLDDRVARIDQIIAARSHQGRLIREAQLERARILTTRGYDKQTRPSGIAWMPEIGESFGLWRIGQAFATGSGTTPRSDKSEFYDGDIPWATTADLRDSKAVVPPRTISDEALATHSALVTYPAGTLLVAMYGATVGALEFSRLTLPSTRRVARWCLTGR